MKISRKILIYKTFLSVFLFLIEKKYIYQRHSFIFPIIFTIIILYLFHKYIENITLSAEDYFETSNDILREIIFKH